MNSGDGLYIGLMSGTSLDSIDAALLRFESGRCELQATHSEPIHADLRSAIAALNQPGGDDELERTGRLDRELGKLFATAANTLLASVDVDASAIRAIGSHGQTLRHRPSGANLDANHAFTLQIGDPATIAELTGITTVADFRRRDLAAGGQGAPLAPAFHAAAFHHPTRSRAIVNIGGMANVTLLPSEGDISGFDTGPGNILMDAWCQLHRQRPYDSNGSWAASGMPDRELLAALLRHSYFSLAPPKSTGRETFNLHWVQTQVAAARQPLAPVDVQASLLELSARSIAAAIENAGHVAEVYCCGGGAYNRALMQRLETLLHPRPLANTAYLGLAPEWVEAAAFAWLAQRTLTGLDGNAPSVTGARGPRILGAVYQA